MLRELTKKDWLSILALDEHLIPETLILRGTRNLKTHYEFSRKQFVNVVDVGTPHGIVEDVLIGELNGRRVGYASVYGGPMASEVTHMFGVLGTSLVVQIGCCGALADGIDAGDLFVADEAYCGDGSSQYYKTDGTTVCALPLPADARLARALALHPTHRGRLFTTAALFAEGEKDIEAWHAQGYAAVDMETAATFAVAEHFGMKRVSVLFAFDNPRRREHMLLTGEDKAERRRLGNERMIEIALAVAGDGDARRVPVNP